MHPSLRPLPRRAPTLYGIALFKLGKGVLFLLLALGVYTLSDNNLPDEFRQLMEWFRLDPERKFLAALTAQFARITESNMLWVAGGTSLYSLLALVEGSGLMLRFPWAGYLAIAEGAFFIPIEIYELSQAFTYGMLTLMAINVLIVWYLYQNRGRLFRHRLPASPKDPPEDPAAEI
jgi:uncharacterized membrane protein (DUF2068 family)